VGGIVFQVGNKKAQWVKLGFSIFHLLRRSKLNLKVGSPIYPIPNYFPPANILMILCLSEDPPYKNKFFLQNDCFEVSQDPWNRCQGDRNQPEKGEGIGLWTKDQGEKPCGAQA
jgi:hypothetical protein